MGPLARRRAHPWLAAASLALLLVSLLVAGIVLWLVQDARQRTFLDIYAESAVIIALFDLFISLIIAVAIILLGQAVVSYEVFTGKTLPRRGLSRHWRRAIILASGYGVAVGGSVVSDLRPLYSLLLTTLLMTGFFALFSWRSYAERERYMAHLRPFVASQRLYDQLLTRSVPPEVDVLSPFRTLCADVLGAQVAYLAAVGPLAPLVGPPLAFPEGGSSLPPLAEVVAQFGPSQTMPAPLESAHYGGAVWAIPLWSERGLIGVFLLGKKRDGGLYAQEEIEIARVSGERLIDTQASVEMARRLMVLQRERLAQSQVIDQQTRRVLHDDILPDLQAAIIAFNNDQKWPDRAGKQAMNLLTGAHRQISDLLHEMPTVTAPEVVRLGFVRALHRTVDNELAHAFDEVTWQIEPEAAGKAKTIPSLTAEVIFYAAREAVRNAAQHGRGAGLDRPFHLCVRVTWNHGLEVQVEDNGVGLNATGQSDRGNGQGLALHSTMMAVIGGELVVESVPNKHTRVSLTLPEKDT
jgi:signal transduction histidine kinase